MRRRGGPILLWLLATATAIAAASAAIGQVGRQVTADAPIDQRIAEAGTDGTVHADGPSGDDRSDRAGDEPPADPAAGVVRTYEAVGGSAAVTIVGTSIDVRWATPKAGFRAEVERSPTGDELRIDFRSDTHRSRIKLEVEDGEVVDDIEEDDRR